MENTQTLSKTENPLLKQARALPHKPGVYIYRNRDNVIIYVGKAIDLQRRVRQYFERDDAVGAKTLTLVSQIDSLETKETLSEFDALLLEAKLIYTYQPKFNVIAKDSKSPLYIKLSTSEELPRIEYVRRQVLENGKTNKKDFIFGPFQTTKVAHNLMRSIRRVVPYCTQKKRDGRPCFYTQIGLCNPCASYISKMENSPQKKNFITQYRHQLFRIRDILQGKTLFVVKSLQKEMETAAKAHDFENAAKIRNQLTALYRIIERKYDPMLYVQSDSNIEDIVNQESEELYRILSPLFPDLKGLHRIECVDISNIMGKSATGSFVVLTHGQIDTSQYRRFKIRNLHTPNDFAMMSEVIKRRFRHSEWQFPDLLIVDGGKGQITSAQKVLAELHIKQPLIGLAKRWEEIIVPIDSTFKTIRLPLNSRAIQLVKRIRDEAHRFAIGYHRFLRNQEFKTFLEKKDEA